MDFPGGPVVESPSVNAGDMGSMPGPGRPTDRGATKPGATTTEPELGSLCSATREATTMRSPHTATKRKPLSDSEDSVPPKIK